MNIEMRQRQEGLLFLPGLNVTAATLFWSLRAELLPFSVCVRVCVHSHACDVHVMSLLSTY